MRPYLTRPREDNEIFTTNKIDPKVSVITISLNHAKFFEETILSVARQTYKNFEHIIIDGGSVDGTKEIAAKYPHLTFISEEDSGCTEAINKGLMLAKGEYVLMPCVSDGYVNENWIRDCVDVLDNDQEVSLVWGLPQYLSEDGYLGAISYSDKFSPTFQPPQKFEWFRYWADTKFWLPEGNFCVRTEIFKECYPKSDNNRTIEPCLEFNYEFNSRGYMPFYLNSVANFGRTHDNQMGQKFAKSGLANVQMDDYNAKSNNYISNNINTHRFRDGKSNIIIK
jgi:glycosyltransferase involved in cell wall biosynthesis